MLERSAKLPINSVALVASAKNEEVVSIVRNLLSEKGILTCLQVVLPVCKPARFLSWRNFIISVDHLFSKLLAGSKVPTTCKKLPYCKLIGMEEFVSSSTDFLNMIDCYILIGHDDRFVLKLPEEKKRPIFKLTLGSVDDEDSASFGLTEVVSKAPTVSLRLELANLSVEKNKSIEMTVQTHHASALHTKSSLLANLKEFFLPAISRLRSIDQPKDTNAVNSENNVKSLETLSWRNGTLHIGFLVNAILNRFFYKNQWFMAVTTRPDGGQPVDWANLSPLLPTTDKLWADPFLVSRDGQDWLFFEEAEFSSSKGKGIGHISVVKINEKGFVGPIKRALDLPWHLAYPNVFEFEDEWYMLPESGGHGKVELYKCVEWPDQWEPHSVLLDDYAGFDASLFNDKGVFYMFVARRADGCVTTDFLDLFWSSSPLGPWLKHKSSPIVLGVDCARPGGRPFVSHDGRIIRPAQDSSGGIYGRSLKFQTILDLSKGEFLERTDQVLEANFSNGIHGVHHFSSTNKIVVIDVLRRLPRFSWMALMTTNIPSVLVTKFVSDDCSDVI